MNSVQPYYRSESACALAERCSNEFNYDSLNVNINIDVILLNRDPVVQKQILNAIENKTPFLLFSDLDHYCIIIPRNLAVYCYVGKKCITSEESINIKQFTNRVRLAFAVYDKFYTDRSLADREHGAREVPCGSSREDLQDDKGGGERSETMLPEQIVGEIQTTTG